LTFLSAGTTDSSLTNHGILQANRLGSHLAAKDVKIIHIFSSDLQRAFKTAEAIRDVQEPSPPHTKLESLREQDFGFYEGKQFSERPKENANSGKDSHLQAHRREPGFKDVESKENMRIRVDSFIDAHLLQLLHTVKEEHAVAVVAHGIILTHLWKALLKRFIPAYVALHPSVQVTDQRFGLEYLGAWANTGYLELEVKKRLDETKTLGSPSSATLLHGASSPDLSTSPAAASSTASEKLKAAEDCDPNLQQQSIPTSLVTPSHGKPQPSRLVNLSLVVRAINSQEHLRGLKKTRGGIGSIKHDSSQKTMDSFFKKRRLE
jgi:broad specificity phosphatase PhoE